MDYIRKIRLISYRIKKHFKNRKFMQAVKKEKAKKYLFRSAPPVKREFFSFSKSKHAFSNVISAGGENLRSYRTLYLFIGILLIASSLYIIAASPYFRISPAHLIIERLDTVTDLNMAYRSIEKIYGKPIFLVNKTEVSDSLMSFQKNIKSVKVSKLYPNGLKIILESYKPEFLTQFAGTDRKFAITMNGILIAEKSANQKLYTLDIVDTSLIEGGFFEYKEGVDSETMKKIMFMRDIFHDVFVGKNVSKFVYFKLENELHIFLESGTIIIVSLKEGISKQLAMLKFYNDNARDTLSTGDLRYLDVRVIGKIYACADRTLCGGNLTRIYPSYYRR